MINSLDYCYCFIEYNSQLKRDLRSSYDGLAIAHFGSAEKTNGLKGCAIVGKNIN
ncbi:hypothetical protein [Gloeothece citriformis]|uniref:hypothetical protein n=1 Tax=Gloeothece citriformis TaxID=2546356 RepID=UPI0002D493FA|nr:hypothetical protein [Gloeothece citriformis]